LLRPQYPFACSSTLRRFFCACTARLTRGIAYPFPSSFFAARSFAGATGRFLLNARFCFAGLCSRLWLWFAGRRSSLPLPVTLNFFFAPEFVFCFGISLQPRVLRWRQHHRHVATLEERLGLDRPQLPDLVGEPRQQVAAAVRVLALAAPEHDRDLDLRPLVQEPEDVALLRLVVVLADLRSELDLLDVDLSLVLARRLRLLLLLVAVLAVVHHPGDGRVGLGRDLDEVEPSRVRVLAGLVRLLDAELLPVLVDQAHARDADRFVDARLRLRSARRLEGPSPRPQIPITKLSLSSFGGERRFRPCLPGTKSSKLGAEIYERPRRLGAAPLADRERLVALGVAVDDGERDLLDLGVADPLAHRLVRLVDLDAERGEPGRERVRRLAMALADRDDPHLHRRDPERESARVVLGEDADEALERAEERAVDDVGRVLLVVGAHVAAADAAGLLRVELDRPHLPGAAERVGHVQVDLRSVERTVAGVQLVVEAPTVERRLECALGEVPLLVGAELVVRPRRELEPRLELEQVVEEFRVVETAEDLVLDLLARAEDVRVVLRDDADARQPVQGAGELVAVQRRGFGV